MGIALICLGEPDFKYTDKFYGQSGSIEVWIWGRFLDHLIGTTLIFRDKYGMGDPECYRLVPWQVLPHIYEYNHEGL
jgi:hypothetical protein